jgi:acetylornithine deacetylase/succinyl-diaminopimelate desuccinylase-like protein
VDLARVAETVDRIWEQSAVPALVDYIRIPAKSPAYDPEWAAHGHLARAVDLIAAWCEARRLPGATVEVLELEGRTPVVLVEVPAREGAGDDTALLYGHLDKQPELTGWREGLGPWTPVLEGDRLYGRGGADDGYSAFAALSALEAVHDAGGAHTRCLVLIEASEESGSPDLPAHVDALADRLGEVSLVVCLDSFAGDYDTLWVTTSLRGLVGVDLRVRVLAEGVHSGVAGGAVPSSFRILRQLLDRIEDAATGELLLPELHQTIPDERRQEAADVIAAGLDPRAGLPVAGSTRLQLEDPVELLLSTTWRPTLAVVGIEGAPGLTDAGNVLRAETAVKLSFRLPPTVDPGAAAAAVRAILAADSPYDAVVQIDGDEAASGWAAAPTAPWLFDALAEGSAATFGRPALYTGVGGAIPFINMLAERFPAAQFVVTGVLGPGSNAHGPNEFLHLPTARRLAACIAHVLDRHAVRPVLIP